MAAHLESGVPARLVPGRARRRLAACALLLTLGGGCGGDDGAQTRDASPARASGTSERPDARTDVEGSFDVGPYELFISCEGTASPTIVHLHGLGGTSDDAALVPDTFGGPQRFCVYDRANMGSSDSDARRQTGADSVRDLHALLAAAGIAGPYVLVGASFGGLLAVMYAGTFPDDVVGLVLLDAMLPGYRHVYDALPPPEREMANDRLEANPERVNVVATLKDAQKLVERIPPDVPVTYLATKELNMPPTWPVKKLKPIVRRQQRAFVKRFPRGRLFLVDSPHHMEPVVPDLVADEIHRIVRSSGD